MKQRLYIITLLLSCVALMAKAQSPIKYLETTFPQLTEIYREDIDKCHAHYIFTVDVSGSMDKFESSVVPSLEQFIQALPNGDKVTVMPFGTDVMCPMGFSGTISDNVKSDLCRNIKSLYNNPNYDQLFKDHTNIYKAVNKMSEAMTTNSEYKVNILISITDFLNNIPVTHPYKRRLNSEEVNDMREGLKAAATDQYVRSIALELSENGGDNKKEQGYCLDQIKNDIFSVTERGLEIVPIGNNREIINEWFEQLRKEILVVKLTAIVEEDNKACAAQMETKIDIDGNTEAHITWEESRLYGAMKIDSTFLTQQGFQFVNNEEAFCKTRDHELTLKMGQVKNKEYGFHKLSDSINIGISFPTQFDNELAKLKIKKPLSGSKADADRIIFTFPLPLWLTILIIVLIILYTIGVIRAFVRNKREKMKGKITISDNLGCELKKETLKPCTETSIGKSAVIKVENAAWRFNIKKREPSPFLVFKKPYFVWTSEAGFVCIQKTITTGKIDNETNNIIILTCKPNRTSDATHKVKIVLNR